ncbi:Uncharacterized protein PCOAH_00001020 [Plasmodium coatneyi]|uniref:Uncharacterized protein n=1 Tax=Plasmodium coatneyi TaxID=208452 RepID=A0A1B1DSF2_9APIC|nr:Uncharacterized protein PCOAH_00001020 [Plasmodium coatneyi]ANQ05711.1 Uncharacterized protein PCOAH_00001020 [Plasmodium coatneyi]
MNQVQSFKSEGQRNCVGSVVSCPQHDNRDKDDDGRRLKREKIKNICKKINRLRRTVCSSTDYFKCVEILFHKAGSKCVVPKRRKKHLKRGKGPVSASPKRGIFFRGKINHLEFFDSTKLCTFFEKHAAEVVQGAAHAEDHFATHKNTLTNGNEFVCPLREEPLSVGKSRLSSGGGVPSQTFQPTGKDSNCCNNKWGDVISNASSMCNANNGKQPRWVKADQLSRQVFTNEEKINGGNAPQDNKRKNEHVDNSGNYSSFNKRMKLGESERDAHTNNFSSEKLQIDVAQFAPGQQVEWDDSPRGMRMKWVAQDEPPAYVDGVPPNTILQQMSTIREERPARKKILMLKVSSILFNQGEGAMKKVNQVRTLENSLEGRKSNQRDEGNARYVMTLPTDEAESGLARNFLTDEDNMEDELHIKEDIQFVYNLFCILAVHMNSLFSMCTQLLRYNFSDLSCEHKELSNQSKRLIILIREYQKEESFVIRFAKCILSVCRGHSRRDAHIGKGTNKGESQHASQPPRRGTITHFNMTTLKKIIRTLLKWEQHDENIQIMLTQNKVDKQPHTFKMEIVNHQRVKQNFDVRKLYFCKYNSELLAYLKRLSTVYSQSNWDSTEGIHTGEVANEVALNRVNLYQKCFSPLWKITKGETNAEKSSRIKCTTGSCKSIENFHSTNDNDGSFGEDPHEDGWDNNTPFKVFPNERSNLTTNQMSIILYLNKILTEEIRCSEDLRIRAKREVEQTETLLWEVKRLQDILSRSGTDVKNIRTNERVLYKTVQMERSTEFFSHQDGKDIHLMEQTTFDENEIDQAICRKDTELFNVTSDTHGMGVNPTTYASTEGEKCVNQFYQLDDFTKGDLIRRLPYGEGIIASPPQDDGNIYRVRDIIGKIIDQLVKSHAEASHPCDKDITSKVDAVQEESPFEPNQGIKELMKELETVKKENSQFGEFLEREKRLSSQLGLEVERQKEAMVQMELQLESERKRNEELRVNVEREELVNDALLSQMEEERKVGSEAKSKLAELEAELTEERERSSSLEAKLEEQKGRSDSLEIDLAEERDRVTSLTEQLQGEKDIVTALKIQLENEMNRVASLEKEKEIIGTIKEELQAEREANASMFAQVEKQKEQLTQQEEEITKMRKKLEEQTERSDPLEVNNASDATNQLGGDKEKATMKRSEGKKKELSDEPKQTMNYGQLYDELVETLVEKESLEKENEHMMSHFNEKIAMLGEQAKYFDEKINHYRTLCESYERTNVQVGRCMQRLEEMIKEIELCPDLSNVNWEEKVANMKKVAKDIKETYEVEKVGTDNLLFDEIIMEKNILMEKILQLESEKGGPIVHTTDKGQTHSGGKDLPNEEAAKYMEEMNFKSLNELFSFHLNILNELSFTKNCYNQLVEENLMKGREYQKEIAQLKKLVNKKEREVGVSDENCKSLLVEVENLKFILNDLFTCGGGRARATRGEDASAVVQEKAEEQLPAVVEENVEEDVLTSVLEEESIVPQEPSNMAPREPSTVVLEESLLTAPSEPPLLAREVPSVGDVLSSVPPKSANDNTLQSNPVLMDIQTSKNARSSNAAPTSKGKRTTPRNRTSRGKKATNKEDAKEAEKKDDKKAEKKEERKEEKKEEKNKVSNKEDTKADSKEKGQNGNETKTNKGTSGNKNSRGSKSRVGSKIIYAESGSAGSDSFVNGSVLDEGGRKYQLRSTNRRK